MGGKFGGAFNLVIWLSGETVPNLIPPILYPHDSGQLADCSRECNIGYSSLSGKEFRVANEHALGAADLSQ